MRKIIFIVLGLILFTTSSCTANNNTDEKGNTDKQKEGIVNQLDAATFQKLVWDYKASPQEWKFAGDMPVVIDFYADWCRPCKMVAPIMDQLAVEYKGKVRFYKVNTDQQRELAGMFRVNSIPAIMYIPKNGKPQMSTGAMPKETYVKAIKELILVN